MSAANASRLVMEPIAPGEAAAVIELWREAGLTRPWNDPARDLAFACASTDATVLVGKRDGVIVASAMVGHDGHRGGIYYLSVAAAERGRGYGKEMLRAAEAWLLRRGVRKVNLAVRSDNAAVIDFYRNAGYEPAETVMLGRWIEPSMKGPARR